MVPALDALARCLRWCALRPRACLTRSLSLRGVALDAQGHLSLTWPCFAQCRMDEGDPIQMQQFGVRFEVAYRDAFSLPARHTFRHADVVLQEDHAVDVPMQRPALKVSFGVPRCSTARAQAPHISDPVVAHFAECAVVAARNRALRIATVRMLTPPFVRPRHHRKPISRRTVDAESTACTTARGSGFRRSRPDAGRARADQSLRQRRSWGSSTRATDARRGSRRRWSDETAARLRARGARPTGR